MGLVRAFHDQKSWQHQVSSAPGPAGYIFLTANKLSQKAAAKCAL
jgi:hypothetical protein